MVGTVVDGVTTTVTVVGLTRGTLVGTVVTGAGVPESVVQPEKNTHTRIRKAGIGKMRRVIAGGLIFMDISGFRLVVVTV
jgi:hypothetical protein